MSKRNDANVPQAVAEKGRSGSTGPEARPSGNSSSSGPTSVLLVADDFLLRTVSVGTLSDLGYHTYEVADADQALQLLSERPDISVMITDVNLPGMDGKALAAEARRIHADLRVLFVTGYSKRMVKDVDMTDGCTGYLSKPYQHRDLENALRLLLD